jgi:bifunctional non-homologous end joining protein LigD
MGGYAVNFQYGRRGSSLQSGTKTPNPVTMARAMSVFEALLKEKLGKGYMPGATASCGVTQSMLGSSASIAQSIAERKAQRITGVLPQLLNENELDQAETYIDDPAWVMQQKFDGRRMLVRVGDRQSITGINRKGESVGLTKAVADNLLALGKTHFVLDAEAIGDMLYVFDVLEYRGGDVRDMPLHVRNKYLNDLLSGFAGGECDQGRATLREFSGKAGRI